VRLTLYPCAPRRLTGNAAEVCGRPFHGDPEHQPPGPAGRQVLLRPAGRPGGGPRHHGPRDHPHLEDQQVRGPQFRLEILISSLIWRRNHRQRDAADHRLEGSQQKHCFGFSKRKINGLLPGQNSVVKPDILSLEELMGPVDKRDNRQCPGGVTCV